MSLRLRDDLHWCECAGRIVFLDVTADRYFCLPARAYASFLALASGQAEQADTERLSMLFDRGFLVRSASRDSFQQPAAIDSPVRDVVGGTAPQNGAKALMGALWWELHAAKQLRTRRLCDVIERASRPVRVPIASPDRREEAIRSIAAAADAIAFVTRSHDRCLVRALAVHSACQARGVCAKLVIGVIAHPFAAHSWVQIDDSVLVGGYEHARLYTPILVIG